MAERLGSSLESLESLADPARRRVYLFVREQSGAVSRDDIAVALGISRRLAAFHLERLLREGLVRAHYARPPGRSGPGAGRSAKYYEPSEIQIDVTIPERRYDLAGKLLTEAILTERPKERAREAAIRVAREEGLRIGEEHRRAGSLRRLGPERTISAARQILADRGFEPYRDIPHGLALRNCPFHSLAQRAPDLICEMNQALVDGILRGLGSENVQAVLACKPGDCCVTLRSPQR